MLVFDCQNALRQLQPRIVRQTEVARSQWAALDLDSEEMENDLHKTVRSLIEVESRNYSLIDARRSLAREELAMLEQASLSLWRIQRSYVPASSAAWISFS